MAGFRLIPVLLFIVIISEMRTFGSLIHKERSTGKTGSNSIWFKNEEIPVIQQGRAADAPTTPNATEFKVQLMTTNTRLGAVDVKSLANRTDGLFVGDDPPDNIYHGAISVHGFVFEFIFDKGIDATEETKYLTENVPLWLDETFQTNKTNAEVKDWLLLQTKVFNQGTYHVVNHNCFHFVKAMIKFLGGTEPKKYIQQNAWLKDNEDIGSVVQELLKISYSVGTDPNSALPTAATSTTTATTTSTTATTAI